MRVVVRFSDGSTLEFDGTTADFRTLIEKMSDLMKNFKEGVKLAAEVMKSTSQGT